MPLRTQMVRAGRLLAVLILLAAGVSSARAANILEGYAWPPSLTQGETVSIMVSSDAPWVDIDFIRVGATSPTLFTASHLSPFPQATPPGAWETGCNWAQSYTLQIPEEWPSGVYYARLTAPSINTRYAIFTVRERNPGSTARILFQNSITTWQAYNNWGGKSLYDHSSSDGIRTYRVSFRRPYAAGSGRGDFLTAEQKLILWLESEGYAVEYCTDIDTHRDPSLQANYDLFLSVGHDEYWSREMRDNIEGRIASGKSVAFLGGNTCWWQIRFSPAFDQIICYKDKAADPYMGIDNSRVTINWFQAPVNRPENSMTGVSFRNGGYVNSGFCMPASEGYGGYRVSRADHWIYAGTGLAEGEIFGQAATIVGYEVDGTRMHWTGGLPVPSGGDGTPSSFAILATSEACGSSLETEPGLNRAATMGLYTAGGAVFSAATIDWCAGLASDPAFQRITRNVIDRLLDLNWVVGVPEDASNPTLSPAPRLTAFPNPFGSTTGVRVDLPRAGEIQLDVFDIQGRRIRELFRGPAASGTREIPWDGTDERGRPVGPGIYFYRLQSDAPPVLARTVRIQASSHPS